MTRWAVVRVGLQIALALVVLVSGSFVATVPGSAASPSSPVASAGTQYGGPAGAAASGPGVIQYNLTGAPQRVAYAPSAQEAFVSEFDRLQVLNVSSHTVVGTINTSGITPAHSADYPVVYDPADGLVYEGLYGNSSIEYVYPGNLTHGTIPIYGGSYAMQLLYDPAALEVLIFGSAGHGFWALSGLSATNRSSEFGASTNTSLGYLYGAYSSSQGMVYVGSFSPASAGHPVWSLNASSLAQVSLRTFPITWTWGNFVSGSGAEVGVSSEGDFSVINITSGAMVNWTWSGTSVGTSYYSLAYSPQYGIYALASKHDYVRLFSPSNDSVWEAAVGGAVPQVGYVGGNVDEFAASSWNPPTSPGVALFIINPSGPVSDVTTHMDTFSLTAIGGTVWIGGSQYGSYPDTDAIESLNLSNPIHVVRWDVVGNVPEYGWSVTVGGVKYDVGSGTHTISESLNSNQSYNWTASAQSYRLSPSSGTVAATLTSTPIEVNISATATAPTYVGQSGGNASGTELSWVNPPGTVNVTLIAGASDSPPRIGCSPLTAEIRSLGNVTSAYEPNFPAPSSSYTPECMAVESWNQSGVMGESPFVYVTPLLANMSYYHLPGWNNLSNYAFNNACGGGVCNNNVGGTQQPVISWTSAGVYYVNSSDDLVYYSFAAENVTHHWPWIPLYQQIMMYRGIENTEWITPNGEWVYEFGLLSPSDVSNGVPLTFYGVNISSGQTVEHNFTGYALNGESANIQANIIGIDGEYNTVALLWVPTPTFVLYSLTNGTQWQSGNSSMLGKQAIDGLEANNVYWVPELNSMVEIWAGGVPKSGWTQLRWNGEGFQNVSWGLIPSASNGVQGLYFNLTSHRLYSDVQATVKHQYTFFWQINGTNTDLGPIQEVSTSIEITAPVHRMMEAASGWAVGGTDYVQNGLAANSPAIWATAFEPNGSVTAADPYAMLSGWDWSPQSLEGLGYDSVYQLYPLLSDCYLNACAIAGDNASWAGSGNVALVGSAPFPAGAPLVLGPPAAPTLAVKLLASSAWVNWTEPASSEALNFTLWWGPKSAGLTHSESLFPTNDSFLVGGLSDPASYEFEVIAHNLDWYGEAGYGLPPPSYAVTVSESGLPQGYHWSLTWNGTSYASNASSITISAPNGTYSYQIPTTGGLNPTPASGTVVIAGSTLSVAVRFSAPASQPGKSASVTSVSVGATYVVIDWSAASGATNYSLAYGSTCSALGTAQSLGTILEDNLSGLTANTAYCVKIVAWNGTAQETVTNDTEIYTGAPSITSVDALTIDVLVNWANPSGEPPVLVDAVYLYAADGTYLGSSGTGGPATSITLAGLDYSTSYSVRIKVEYSGGGSSELSEPVSFTTPGCTQGCSASAQSGLLGWLLVPTNAAIVVGFALSAIAGAFVMAIFRGPKPRRR